MRLLSFSVLLLFLKPVTPLTTHQSILLIKDSLFALCSVLPGDEVAGLSPFGLPIKEVREDDRMDGYCGCHYDFQSKDDYPQCYITINQFSSPAVCLESFSTNRQYWVDMYQRSPDYISHLADSAAFFGNAEPDKCDDCGLQVVSGKYLIRIAFKGMYDMISAGTKKNSAVSMVKRLFEKKPYLKRTR